MRHRAIILMDPILFLDLEMTDKLLVRLHTSSVMLIKWPWTIPFTTTHVGKQIPSDATCAPTTAGPWANDARYCCPVTGSVRTYQTHGVTCMWATCSKVLRQWSHDDGVCVGDLIYAPYSRRVIQYHIADNIRDMTLVIPLHISAERDHKSSSS